VLCWRLPTNRASFTYTYEQIKTNLGRLPQIPPEAVEMIATLMRVDATQRPSLQAIKRMKYMSKVDVAPSAPPMKVDESSQVVTATAVVETSCMNSKDCLFGK
jgi:hypothetical protein